MVAAVLDASAFLRFLDDEPGAEYIQGLLKGAATGEVSLLMSAVNWGEVVYAVARDRGIDGAHELINKLPGLRLTVVSCGAEEAAVAAFFKERFKMPYPDAFAASLASRHSAPLVTADYDFKGLPPGTLKVEFLPSKSKRP